MSVYTETLSNGLEVYLLPYENKENYYITFATRFGSDVLEFEKNNDIYTPPLGIAHFLEHKMFEQEDGKDPFTFFSKSGTDSNASTSFERTQYMCTGTKNYTQNLKFLINFVSNPYYTDANVEKEKGIIAEEIKMYRDIPDFKLEMKLREAIYHHGPRRLDIAGTVDEINKITKEDLYKCYRSFYIPNNMFLIAAGNIDPEETIHIIKEELEYRNKDTLPKIIEQEEPKEVNKKKITMKENIEVPKLAVGVKIPVDDLKLTGIELNLYLNMITAVIFGPSSEFRERVRNQKIASGFYQEWETYSNYKTFYIMASSTDLNQLLKEIEKEFDNIKIDTESFERIKKVWIANEVKMIDNVHASVANIFSDVMKYKKIIPNRIEMIRNMKIEKLNKLLKEIHWDNRSIVKMVK